MEKLPAELIKEIMLRLPVKSLLRCRCVRKSFRAIIDSKSFIYSHLERCSEYGIHRKLICREQKPVDQFGYGTKFHTFDINDGSIEKFLLTDDLLPSSMHFLFASYCNGLVLLRLSSQKFSVWNPSTRDYRNLPKFPVKYSYKVQVTWTLGLGYDSVADDYKVIVMASTGYSTCPKVWILGLKSRTWRKLEDFPFAEYNRVEIGGNGDCFVDSALHFLCYPSDQKSHIVVAFDVANETFSEVLEPVYPKQLPKGYELCLHALAGSLCISFFDYNMGQIDLYRRKKEGMEFTWAKLYSVTVQQISEDNLPYIRSGKLLEYSEEQGKALFLYYGQLFSFDIREKSLKEIKIKNTNVLDYVVFFESLVPVGC